MHIRWLRSLCFFSAILIASTQLLVGQLNRGTIEGNVTDPQGAAVPGVEITITSVATNVVTTTQTNSAGYYRAPALVPGIYNAHFTANGFTPVDVTAIEVQSANRPELIRSCG